MKGYKAARWKGELFTSETESILFFISDGDASKRNLLRKTKRRVVLDYYYQVRLQKLNELLGMVAQLKKMEKNKKK
ncbi:MAG: hypothetical protein HYS25_00875 [Ignavibacteriales bacterium]|nr:hypothetical protein [Ignavibacteriales bacterium]